MTTLWLSLTLLAPADGPSFQCYQRAESVPTGELAGMGEGFSVTLSGVKATTIPAGELVELRRADLALPPPVGGPSIKFANGDRVPGTLTGGGGLFLTFRPTWLPNGADDWKIPLSQLTLLRSADANLPEWREWVAGDRKRDALLLRNGDFRTGTLAEITPEGVAFGEGTYPLMSVAAVGFSSALSRWRKPTAAYGRLVLIDGTRLSVKSIAGEGALRAKTFFRRDVTIPPSQVAALTVHNGPAVYLSELEAEIKQEAFFGKSWPWRRDRNITIRHPRFGIEHHDRGLAAVPRTRFRFTIEDDFRRFESWVGLKPSPDPSRRIGSCEVRMSPARTPPDVPGGETFRLKAEEPARLVRLKLAGAKELNLEADFGRGGHVGAEVIWASARLIR